MKTSLLYLVALAGMVSLTVCTQAQYNPNVTFDLNRAKAYEDAAESIRRSTAELQEKLETQMEERRRKREEAEAREERKQERLERLQEQRERQAELDAQREAARVRQAETAAQRNAARSASAPTKAAASDVSGNRGFSQPPPPVVNTGSMADTYRQAANQYRWAAGEYGAKGNQQKADAALEQAAKYDAMVKELNGLAQQP